MRTFPTDDPVDPEIDEETRRILDERLRTIDEDIKTARPAKEVLAEFRAEMLERVVLWSDISPDTTSRSVRLNR